MVGGCQGLIGIRPQPHSAGSRSEDFSLGFRRGLEDHRQTAAGRDLCVRVNSRASIRPCSVGAGA